MASTYPVRLEGRPDAELSQWLWLVKWFLVIPHLIVLTFLWIAFWVLTVFVFFAILITARYPRGVFDFNVGVMRWTWRVAFYAYGALGTDRYPPFSLGEVPDYPATLHVDYPERLSRGLVLIKSWLLAIPHYLIIGFFLGGAGYLGWRWGGTVLLGGSGLITLLVLIGGVVLLFTRKFPPGIRDFVLGMDRWVVRVGAYAMLMTDKYPPFRLDTGSGEAATVVEDSATAAARQPARPVV
nr:POSSIBLE TRANSMEMBRANE PROTEIN [Kibdelosporangium sp. MJ126-NF4]CTQ98977.1 POSSIBLE TRANSMEMBRANE PROTEIN [Kibdelosporangium sp. MJ126-NF4]